MSCNRDLDFFPVISFSYKSKKLKLLNKIGHYQLPDSFSFGLEVTRWPLHPKAWSSSHGIFGKFHCCWKCCLLFSWILLSFSAQLVSAKSFVTLLVHYSFVLLSFFSLLYRKWCGAPHHLCVWFHESGRQFGTFCEFVCIILHSYLLQNR